MTFKLRPEPGLQEALNERHFPTSLGERRPKEKRTWLAQRPLPGSRPLPPNVNRPWVVPGLVTPPPREGAAGPPSTQEAPRPQALPN